jgi:ribosome-associated toxin RatA of RatAB toxin-antitoxin module
MRRGVAAIDEAALPFPPGRVHGVLLDVHRYSEWWPEPFRFEVLDSGPVRVGTRVRVFNGSILRWLATLSAVGPERIAFHYSDGAWEGDAWWSFRSTQEGTAAVFRISLDPVPIWLRLLGRWTNLSWRHSRQMQAVFRALDRRLQET